MHPLTIRPARGDEGAALAEFAARTFCDAFAADTGPSDLALHLARSYGPHIQAAEIAAPHLRTLVAEDAGGALAAYAQLRLGPPPPGVTGPAPVEIWRFYVDRTHQGHGLARRLMDAALDAAAGLGARTVWLSVWERNPRAIAFYRKAGFSDVGSQIYMVGTDAQHDRLLALDVPIDALVRAFFACTLPRAQWTHRAHLTVALWHARRFPYDAALARMREAIQRYNASNGVASTPTGGYHETLTVFYMRLVAAWAAAHPAPYVSEADVDALAGDLGARDLPLEYYSRALLRSEAARAGWVEPDLKPCP